MKTKQTTFKIAILVAAFAVVSVAHAQTTGWSNPTATPPGNNVSAPLHVGSEAQTKAGGIGISGATGGLRLFDRANTTESWQWYANKDTTTNKSWLRLWNHQDLRDQVTVDPTGMRLFGNLWSGGVVTGSLQVTGGTPTVGKVLGATDTQGTVGWIEPAVTYQNETFTYQPANVGEDKYKATGPIFASYNEGQAGATLHGGQVDTCDGELRNKYVCPVSISRTCMDYGNAYSCSDDTCTYGFEVTCKKALVPIKTD